MKKQKNIKVKYRDVVTYDHSKCPICRYNYPEGCTEFDKKDKVMFKLNMATRKFECQIFKEKENQHVK